MEAPNQSMARLLRLAIPTRRSSGSQSRRCNWSRIGPALVSALCRAYARASLVVDDEHHHVLDRLNRLLADDLSANRFVTFALVFLDPTTSEVEILSAGHGPILLYRRYTGSGKPGGTGNPSRNDCRGQL
jgi:hypothetical protein